MLYLNEGSGSLARKDSPKFEKKSLKTFDIVFMSYVNDLLSSIALKFETTVFLGIPRDFRIFHNSFGLPTLSESFSSKKACFFAAINFCASYLVFLYNSLLIWSLAFLNA